MIEFMDMHWYVVIAILMLLLLAFMGLSIWQHQRLLAWKMAFGMLSNAERILLLWPHARGQAIKTLTVMVDSKPDGFARLAAGPTMLAKLPLAQLNEHRYALQDLIDAGKPKATK